MVGCKGDDGVSECGFPENGGGKVCRCSVQRYVKVVYVAVHFCLCCETKFRVYGVEVICNVMYVGLAGVEYYQDVVNVPIVVNAFVFFCQVWEVRVLYVLKEDFGN